MKNLVSSAAVAALSLGSSSAYISNEGRPKSSKLEMSKGKIPVKVSKTPVKSAPIPKKTVRVEDPSIVKSIALPWAARPEGLDEYPLSGDRGFDPLNLGTSAEKLIFYREAELKHGRLAMLAAAGWPAGELFDGKIAGKFGLPDLLVRPDGEGIGLEPSLLNGGLGTIPFAYWLLVVGLTGSLELQLEKVKADYAKLGVDRPPGDFEFDPLGFFPKTEDEQSLMYERELRHGRIAMIAIFLFALEEFITKVPVVEENRVFFGLTPGEEAVEEEVYEVARESFSFLGYLLKQIHF